MKSDYIARLWSLVGRAALVCGLSGEIGISYGQDWDVVRKNGENRVTSANLHRFYDFENRIVEADTKTVRLIHPQIAATLSGGEEKQTVKINGVRFRLFHPVLWDEENQELLLHTSDLTWIFDPVVRANLLPRKEKPTASIQVDPGPFAENEIEWKVIAGRLRQAGWNIESPDQIDHKPTLLLELNFKALEKGETKPGIETEWRMTKPGMWSSKRINGDPLYFATALHAAVLQKGGFRDLAIRASDPVELDRETPPKVSITIRLPENFKNLPLLWDGLGEGLKREHESRSPGKTEGEVPSGTKSPGKEVPSPGSRRPQ